jgi:hypothetical protein
MEDSQWLTWLNTSGGIPSTIRETESLRETRSLTSEFGVVRLSRQCADATNNKNLWVAIPGKGLLGLGYHRSMARLFLFPKSPGVVVSG